MLCLERKQHLHALSLDWQWGRSLQQAAAIGNYNFGVLRPAEAVDTQVPAQEPSQATGSQEAPPRATGTDVPPSAQTTVASISALRYVFGWPCHASAFECVSLYKRGKVETTTWDLFQQ